jgi:hypothetical protein
MKAYEFSAKVTADGQLEFPATLLKPLMNNQQVRVIVLVDENPEIEGILTKKMLHGKALLSIASLRTIVMRMLFTTKADRQLGILTSRDWEQIRHGVRQLWFSMEP